MTEPTKDLVKFKAKIEVGYWDHDGEWQTFPSANVAFDAELERFQDGTVETSFDSIEVKEVNVTVYDKVIEISSLFVDESLHDLKDSLVAWVYEDYAE